MLTVTSENYNQQHNKQILTRIVEEYLYKKGRIKTTCTAIFSVPIYDLAPKGQVVFASSSEIEKYLKRLEEEVGEWRNIIQVSTKEKMSETERRAKEIVAKWE